MFSTATCIVAASDDVLMFVQPNANDLFLIIELLDIFGQISGLVTYIAKSSLTTHRRAGVDDQSFGL